MEAGAGMDIVANKVVDAVKILVGVCFVMQGDVVDSDATGTKIIFLKEQTYVLNVYK